MDLFAPLDRLLTIRARQIKSAGATLPGVVPSHKYLWHYVASWPDGSLAASLLLAYPLTVREVCEGNWIKRLSNSRAG